MKTYWVKTIFPKNNINRICCTSTLYFRYEPFSTVTCGYRIAYCLANKIPVRGS